MMYVQNMASKTAVRGPNKKQQWKGGENSSEILASAEQREGKNSK